MCSTSYVTGFDQGEIFLIGEECGHALVARSMSTALQFLVLAASGYGDIELRGCTPK